ncbi:aminopeptidase P family protein [Candidatus Micrarchaeota archaeon]|nr:aminopeptidase P family protein [Candidatus Micrarchaeota archaeon]
MNRLKRFFDLSEVDALVLANGDAAREADSNFSYFSGVELDNSILILKPKEKVLLVSPLNFELAKEKFSGRIEKFERGKAWRKAEEFLRNEKKIGLNFDSVTLRAWKKMRGLRGKATDVSKQLLELRAVKEENEVEKIRKAVRIAERILREAENDLKVGASEKQVAGSLKKRALDEGVEVSFEPIVSFGKNTRFPHSKPTGKKLARGEHVLIDFGVRVGGYCSDLARCFFPASGRGEAEKTYEELKEVMKEIASFIRPGVEASEAAKYANKLIIKAGFPKMIHSLGHGVGLQVHESPKISVKSKDVFRKGMVFALEPAVYTEKFGARFEENFFIRKKTEKI